LTLNTPPTIFSLPNPLSETDMVTTSDTGRENSKYWANPMLEPGVSSAGSARLSLRIDPIFSTLIRVTARAELATPISAVAASRVVTTLFIIDLSPLKE
jgi:hypothetical protein